MNHMPITPPSSLLMTMVEEQAGAFVTIAGTRPSAASYDTDLDRFVYRQLDLRDASRAATPLGV